MTNGANYKRGKLHHSPWHSDIRTSNQLNTLMVAVRGRVAWARKGGWSRWNNRSKLTSTIRVEKGLESRRWEIAYKPFVGFRLAEEYHGRWKEIGEILGNLKWPEGKTPTEIQQLWQEATKYLHSDGVLYWSLKTYELLAIVIVSAERKRKAMQAADELSGHGWREGALQQIAEWYWWPEMYVDVKDFAGNVGEVQQDSASTEWITPDKLNHQSPMAVSGDGYFVHPQNKGWVSSGGGSEGISQRMGRGRTTNTGFIAECSRLRLRRRNLVVRTRGTLCSEKMSREHRMDWPHPQMLPYRWDHLHPVTYRC